MPRKKTAPAADKRTVLDTVTGRHPALGNVHIMTRYTNGEIRIERGDYVSVNPATGEEERTIYPVLDHEEAKNHTWLWSTISLNKIK